MAPLLFYDEDDAHLGKVFRRYDLDGDGSLDRSELREAFFDAKVYISERDLDRLFEEYDKDKDGSIGFEEFREMNEDVERRMKADAELDARQFMRTTATALEYRKTPRHTDSEEPPATPAA